MPMTRQFVSDTFREQIADICENAGANCTWPEDRRKYQSIASLVRDGHYEAAYVNYRNMDTAARDYITKALCGNLTEEVAIYFKFSWV